ncbi:unnamed protein product [Prorocentrum cordatum]|uniref:Uncharacterized protein n=1 Tax=Prorocentrum cordatum TaxID=2364126 RepID=A0ABN9TFP1_9DINO|nr:unnamed protein product [Polarella glacialis]
MDAINGSPDPVAAVAHSLLGKDAGDFGLEELQSVVMLAAAREKLVSDGDRLDTRSEKGRTGCKRFLRRLEKLAVALSVERAPREYRGKFTANFRALFAGEDRSYRVDILEAALSLMPAVWANGEAYQLGEEAMSRALGLRQAWAALGELFDGWASPEHEPGQARREMCERLERLDVAWASFEDAVAPPRGCFSWGTWQMCGATFASALYNCSASDFAGRDRRCRSIGAGASGVMAASNSARRSTYVPYVKLPHGHCSAVGRHQPSAGAGGELLRLLVIRALYRVAFRPLRPIEGLAVKQEVVVPQTAAVSVSDWPGCHVEGAPATPAETGMAGGGAGAAGEALPAQAEAGRGAAAGSADGLREAGNERARAGDHAGAAECYEAALARLREEGAPKDRYAPVHSNLSLARLALGQAAQALESAEASARADGGFAKAYFRQARALLALGRPHEAAIRARCALFLEGGYGSAASAAFRGGGGARPGAQPAGRGCPAEVLKLLGEVVQEVPELVVRCCDGHGLGRLGGCSRRLRGVVCRSQLLRRRAAELCPEGSPGWLRTDLLPLVPGLGDGAGWLYAARRAAAGAAVRDLLAIAGQDQSVRTCEPIPGGGAARLVRVPASCLPFTLCWGPQGEYLAFTALRLSTARPALVLAPAPGRGGEPIITPLIGGMLPYYICPSPCGTRVALLGKFGGRQALLIADASQVVAPDRELAPPVSLSALGTAAPLYFDWAPHRPDLLLACAGRHVVQVPGHVVSEAAGLEKALEQRPCEPDPEITVPDFPPPAFSFRGDRVAWRAPQWLPASPGHPEGRWLVPRDGAGGRVSLALVVPATLESEVVCEHLPPDVHFAASSSCRWVAWSGLHDARGHGGVFARRLPPSEGSPLMVFSGAAEALSWGGDRLALLLREPGNTGQLVWAVWDPPEDTASGLPGPCRARSPSRPRPSSRATTRPSACCPSSTSSSAACACGAPGATRWCWRTPTGRSGCSPSRGRATTQTPPRAARAGGSTRSRCWWAPPRAAGGASRVPRRRGRLRVLVPALRRAQGVSHHKGRTVAPWATPAGVAEREGHRGSVKQWRRVLVCV